MGVLLRYKTTALAWLKQKKAETEQLLVRLSLSCFSTCVCDAALIKLNFLCPNKLIDFIKVENPSDQIIYHLDNNESGQHLYPCKLQPLIKHVIHGG